MDTTVYINGRFLNQRVTGVQRYARETLHALDLLQAQRAGSTLQFVLLAPPGTVAPDLRCIEFRPVGPLKGNAWEQLSLPMLTLGQPLLSFCPTGPLFKSRQIVTFHDAAVYAVPEAFGRVFRAWYHLQFQVLSRRLPRVLTVSEFSRRELELHLPALNGKLRVTTEGWQHIQRQHADLSVLNKHQLRPKQFVLAVSSQTPNKNFRLLVEAVQYLLQRGECPFDVAVAGGKDQRIFAGAELPDVPQFKQLGYVSDAQLRALYEHAGLFVFPSFYEGFGLPALEAMASGCPVVASNRGASLEVCGAAARYVEPDDAPGLAHLLQSLMSDVNLRNQLSAQGLEHVSKYSWERSAQLTAQYVLETFDAAC